ncbi:unnamed protein product [Clonostachys chloroleuca]|uniref:ATP-dependent DNA helicase PIF1 n=1 Tax=Clonostachys chloroleuca TaxID=1926264 RepID=A0AA35M823_9HYPO|nr:unnamed protein product [Clonostachys chloroleuca]
MLGKANKAYVANPPPPRNPLAKHLNQAGIPSTNQTPGSSNGSDIRMQFKKPGFPGFSSGPARTDQSLQAETSTQPTPKQVTGRGSLMSLYGNSSSNSFKDESSHAFASGNGTQNSVSDIVWFDENDFSDDDNLDLDFEAPIALPGKPEVCKPKENIPPSSQYMSWSSSPPSHWEKPSLARAESSISTTTGGSLKRESFGEDDDLPPVKKAKKRSRLPWKEEDEDDEANWGTTPNVAKTPAHQSSKGFWDPSASATKEKKRLLKNQHQTSKTDTKDELPPDAAQIVAEVSRPKNDAFALSKEQERILDLVVNKGKSLFFTGPAGTGKSVLMRAIIKELKAKYARDPERVAVTAPTGLAACNIGGITLHSFSGIGLGKEDAATLTKKIRRNPKAKNRWLKAKCLIIDEISMVDAELFDKLSQIGRVIRNNGRPWGGIQLIITGDFFQLPPVPDGDSKREVKFAFEASTWNTTIDHTIGLTEVFRQRDPVFAKMLNEMRLGEISPASERAFKALARPLKFNDGVDMAELYPTRAQVENSNASRLQSLPGVVQRYPAYDSGEPAIRDKLLANMMAPKSIDLKVNAQVMLIKNLDENLVNGSLGKVIAFSDERTFDMTSAESYDDEMSDAMDKARKKLKGYSRDADTDSVSGQKFPVVQFTATDGTSRIILCQPEEWKVELPNGEVQAKRMQLPLILAWALSIHKAQGQTLERVTVNLGKIFERGQAYVALSRATSQAGLQVLNFNKAKVMAHPRVCQFYRQLYSVDDAHARKVSSITDVTASRKGPTLIPKKAAPTVVSLLDD